MEATEVWTLASSALVLIMTPGLALFYGGLVRVRSVVNMMLFSVSAMGVVGVLWILFGYSMSVIGDGDGWFAGSPLRDFGLAGTDPAEFIGVGFGAVFAMITTALISGAIADRVGLGSWVLFSGLWATLVYFPVAAWVWGGGWISQLGTWLGTPDVIDLAGGTAIHINAGAAALALALVVGKRQDFAPGAHRPHSIPLVTIGAALLWFGWIGFNSGLATDGATAGLILVNTLGAPAASILGWLAVDALRARKPGVIGAASGAVAGLVAITPAAANLSPGLALLLVSSPVRRAPSRSSGSFASASTTHSTSSACISSRACLARSTSVSLRSMTASSPAATAGCCSSRSSQSWVWLPTRSPRRSSSRSW